jgi:hypothetical protein
MQDAIMIRVTAEDFTTWFAEHDGCKEAREEYGITDGPIYRAEREPNTVLLHLNVESFDRARGWFQDDRFKAAVGRAGNVQRDVYLASPKPS